MTPTEIYQNQQRKKGTCIEYRCTSKAHPKKAGRCHKHYARYFKQKHPAAYAFQRLKTNARVRGVAFNLSLQEFRQWAKETGYLDNCGRKKKNLTIDRINRDNPLGYHIDNIQVLTNGENARKYYAFEAKGLEYPSQEPEAFDSMDEMKITSDEMAF
tara:strand:+ start:8105 stop:8575 length:471 start_codon:yes stop_codon:yes gene_type:complete